MGNGPSTPSGMSGPTFRDPIVRDRDETGHRSGLGTMARHPIDAAKGMQIMQDNYDKMVAENKIGGNYDWHTKANREVTEAVGPEMASALSAAREEYKNHRPNITQGSYGDKRTPEEVSKTMEANRLGREEGMEAWEKKQGK